jgi:uncharacterized DUF497 family protein
MPLTKDGRAYPNGALLKVPAPLSGVRGYAVMLGMRRPDDAERRLLQMRRLRRDERLLVRQTRSHPFVHTSIVYTEVVLDRIERFDWDNANVAHILRHAVTPFEVEEVTDGRYVVIPARTIKREKRWKLFGKTASGRYLVVVFTVRRKLFRIVTAYEMDATERSKYAPQID